MLHVCNTQDVDGVHWIFVAGGGQAWIGIWDGMNAFSEYTRDLENASRKVTRDMEVIHAGTQVDTFSCGYIAAYMYLCAHRVSVVRGMELSVVPE